MNEDGQGKSSMTGLNPVVNEFDKLAEVVVVEAIRAGFEEILAGSEAEFESDSDVLLELKLDDIDASKEPRIRYPSANRPTSPIPKRSTDLQSNSNSISSFDSNEFYSQNSEEIESVFGNISVSNQLTSYIDTQTTDNRNLYSNTRSNTNIVQKFKINVEK